MKSIRGYLFVVGATVFWGLSAVIAKGLFDRQVDPLLLVQMRVTFSALVMLAFFIAFRRGELRIHRDDVLRFVLLGIVGIAGSNFTYYFAIQQTNVNTAILMQYTAPLLVLGYATVTKEEPLSVSKIAAGLASVAGCYLVVGGGEFSFARVSVPGLLSGVGSAVCWAFTNIYLRRLLHK
ncbi:MAG: DMT family transporter, partial [Terriglobia bacterium]